MNDKLPKDWKTHHNFWKDEKSFKELDDILQKRAKTLYKGKPNSQEHREWEEAQDDIRYARLRWDRTKKNMSEAVKQKLTGNEEFTVKDCDVEYTGGGISVAFGVYTNGLGFSIGDWDIIIYDEDSRHQFETDDYAAWEEEHIISETDDYTGFSDESPIFKSTLKQVFEQEVAKHSNLERWQVMDRDDFFRNNEDILNTSKNESLTNFFKRRLNEGLVQPFPEDIEFFEHYIIDTLGYDIEAKGVNWFDRTPHYQVRSQFNNHNRQDLREFAKELNKLDELMDKREIPMTYNAGLTDDGFITAGIDLRKKWIPDNEDSVKPQPTKIKVRDFDLLDDDDELIDIDEARYSDAVPYEKRRYWYWTKHGLGPGTLPKGVNVLDAKDGQNQKGTWGVFVLLDAVLNTDELKQYDLIELAPQEERQPVRANIWGPDGETKGYVRESRQLNEGPGAGYKISGKIGDVRIGAIDIFIDGETDNAIYYGVEGDITADLVDVGSFSYYYGGEIPETPIRIDWIGLSVEKSWELPEPTEEDIYDLLMGLDFETVYGGGWSHSTFDNDLSLTYNDCNYSSEYDLDKLEFIFTDPKAVDAIDKYATGENFDVEFSVLDEDEYEVEFFDNQEDAIEFAKEESYPYVAETHWGWEYLGNDDYNTTDRVDSSEIIWKNDELEVED